MNIGENYTRTRYKIWWKDGHNHYLEKDRWEIAFSKIEEAEKYLERETIFIRTPEGPGSWRQRTLQEKREVMEVHEIKETITRIR